MHITDKEKKAIYEAMKQIRENRRLQEQKRLSDFTTPGDFDGLPTDVYRGRNNNFVYHNSNEAGVRLASTNNFGPNDTTFMSADPIGRNDPRPMGDNIIFTPDGKEITGTGRGSSRGGADETKRRQGRASAKKFGLARINSTVDGTRFPGSSKGFKKYNTKSTKTKLREGEIDEQTGMARPAQSAINAALALTKTSAPAGPYDLNINPYDEVPQITASSPAADLRRTDAYKDKAGNIHVGAPVTSSDPQTGFTLTRNQYGELDAVTGTGRSREEFEAGMRDARRRKVDLAGMSPIKASYLNLRDRMRGRPGRADMIGD